MLAALESVHSDWKAMGTLAEKWTWVASACRSPLVDGSGVPTTPVVVERVRLLGLYDRFEAFPGDHEEDQWQTLKRRIER
jgi:hypothetical protein